MCEREREREIERRPAGKKRNGKRGNGEKENITTVRNKRADDSWLVLSASCDMQYKSTDRSSLFPGFLCLFDSIITRALHLVERKGIKEIIKAPKCTSR